MYSIKHDTWTFTRMQNGKSYELQELLLILCNTCLVTKGKETHLVQPREGRNASINKQHKHLKI